MLKTALKTTSALALCAGVFAPPAVAQQTRADLPLCSLTDPVGPFPCVLEDGKRIKNARALARETAARAIEAQTGDAPASDAPASDTPPAAEADAPAARGTPPALPAEAPTTGAGGRKQRFGG